MPITAVIFSPDLKGIFVNSCLVSIFLSINPDGKDDVLSSVPFVAYIFNIALALVPISELLVNV